MGGKLRLWALNALTACAAVGALLAPGCSSAPAGATPCNEAPWQCGTGSTCWPDCVCPSGQTCTTSNCTLQFSCLSSKSGVSVGENCSLQNGSPQCGDNQTCVAFEDAGTGHWYCRAYCDMNQGCAPGDTCVSLGVTGGSATEHVCVPPALSLDGGLMIDTGAGSGGGDAASDRMVHPDVTGQLMDGSTGNM